MQERWWAIKVAGYNSWTFDQGKAETARRNGYEVHGPFVLCDDAAIERGAAAMVNAGVLSHREVAELILRAAGETP